MIDAARVNALHDTAMELAGRALHADLHGDQAAASLFEEAFRVEREAALMVVEDTTAEPTRSILLRSAATLALDCHNFREAERLVALALTGNPPSELCDELRDVLETVYFSRHLSLRGLELDRSELQMSLVGNAVGFGVAESSQFLRRAETLEKLLVRTVERLRGVSFRETGSPSRSTLQGFEVFYSEPRAASFAIRIRLGRHKHQLRLPFDDTMRPNEVVDDFLACVSHFNAGEVEALRERMVNEAYLNNFTALAKKLAPDGQKIRTVGFTSQRGEETREVALTRPPGNEWQTPVDERLGIEVVGMVRSADETSKHRKHPVFGVEGDTGKTTNVYVRPGVLQDIVKPFWGDRVRVTAVKKGRRIEMVEITAEETSEPREPEPDAIHEPR